MEGTEEGWKTYFEELTSFPRIFKVLKRRISTEKESIEIAVSEWKQLRKQEITL